MGRWSLFFAANRNSKPHKIVEEAYVFAGSSFFFQCNPYLAERKRTNNH
ncbi:hypothetical protein LPE509_02079 [Legionella pneumophila subsp. pneumophila LPE509]|nr:hypothetical protein LPE509_02079 [Legionella pneumophila subsp. pneumophila LPE509]